MSKTIKYFSVLLLATILLAACKKSSSDTSLLVLNIRNSFGADSLIMGKSYRSPGGDSVLLNRVDYYITNIQLTNTDGSVVSAPGYVLVTPSSAQNIFIGSVPAGNYKGIAFDIGLPSGTTNVDSSMLLNSNHDYINIALEGFADSTNGNLAPNKAFSYHIGTDSLIRTVSLPDHSASPFNASGGKVVTINLVADLSQLFKNINIRATPVCNTTDYPAVADTIAAHLQPAFSYAN